MFTFSIHPTKHCGFLFFPKFGEIRQNWPKSKVTLWRAESGGMVVKRLIGKSNRIKKVNEINMASSTSNYRLLRLNLEIQKIVFTDRKMLDKWRIFRSLSTNEMVCYTHASQLRIRFSLTRSRPKQNERLPFTRSWPRHNGTLSLCKSRALCTRFSSDLWRYRSTEDLEC